MWYDLKGRFYTPFKEDVTVSFANIHNERERFEEAEKHSKVHTEELWTASFFIVLDWFKKELDNIACKEDTTPDNFIPRAEKELEGMLYRYKLNESQAITLGIVMGISYGNLKLAHALAKLSERNSTNGNKERF